MNCPETHELLDDTDAEILAHVAICAACQERRDKLTKLLTLEPAAEPPAHVLPELLRRIDEQVAREVRSVPLPEGSMEPVAFLGGQIAEPETLPALPPAGVSAVYSASDFIAAPVEEPEPEPDYAEPVEVATPDANDFESYAEHPAEALDTIVEPPVEAEPELPKTISQRDAEDIIQRITTKKILPDVRPAEPVPVELTRRRGPRLGLVAASLLFVMGGLAGAVYFKDEVGPYLPEVIQSMGGYVPPPPEKPAEQIATDTPERQREKAFRAKVLESEWRAFGYASLQEMLDSNKPATPGDAPRDGGDKK